MDQTLRLYNHVSVIGPTTDYAYRWGLNVGLPEEKALRLALAVDEVVTDVVRFAFPRSDDTFDVTFRADLSTAEVIIHERGEPFDPARHPYDPERAVNDGEFEGAGFEIVRHCVDDFAFLNRGREGKEFRLMQNIESPHVADVLSTTSEEPTDTDPESYALEPVTPADAEDIAKLIYRTYGYTYAREDLYYPARIERALEQDEKFGVLVRTDAGTAVGYFAVLDAPDSNIGEVGEAVVDVDHRRRGLMKRMLRALIEQAEDRGVTGVFGEAVTAHDISQRVNHHFGMVSTALLLGFFPPERFRGMDQMISQPISIVIDFRPLKPYDRVTAFVPDAYADLLRRIYDALGAEALRTETQNGTASDLADTTVMDPRIQYDYNHVVFVVDAPGRDLVDQIRRVLADLNEDLTVACVDLPLDDPRTPAATEQLREAGFVFSGLMPRFHDDRDHLRLQYPFVELDPDGITVYSELAATLKEHILEEQPWTSSETETRLRPGFDATST